jgi:two-component system response regulator NreC
LGVTRSMNLRILIADDHSVLRATLKAMLETHAGWQVCGEATNGLEAVRKAADLKPDVIILDLSMPKLSGFEAASQIAANNPEVPILIYTQHAVSPEAKLEAKKNGARDVINKEAPHQLLSALKAIHNVRSNPGPQQLLESTDLPTLPDEGSNSDPTGSSSV